MSANINTYAKTRMADVLHAIYRTAGGPGSNSVIEYLAKELRTIYFPKISWFDLSTTERMMLRFAWEYVHRTACPLPLHPEA
jgi:hypothetical protein